MWTVAVVVANLRHVPGEPGSSAGGFAVTDAETRALRADCIANFATHSNRGPGPDVAR